MLTMRWLALAVASAALLFFGLFARAASTAPRGRPFDAQFKDTPCGALPMVELGRPVAGPAPGCMIYRGTRTLTLAKHTHTHTRLRLAVHGPACGSGAWNLHDLSREPESSQSQGQGVIWGTPLQLRYFGVIALANK
jgi:hypothetical protein